MAGLRPAARHVRRAPRRDRTRDGLHEQRREWQQPARSRNDVHARAHVGGRRRRGIHPGDRLRLPLVQDPVLAGVRAPAGPAGADPGDRRWRRWVRALDRARSLHVPVQRTRQDPDDHRARELPREPPGQARLAARDPRGVPARRAATDPGDAPARPRDVAGVRGDPGRHALDVGGQPPVARWPGGRGRGDGADRVDIHPARLPEGASDLLPQSHTRTSRAPDTSCTSRRSRSARVGGSDAA